MDCFQMKRQQFTGLLKIFFVAVSILYAVPQALASYELKKCEGGNEPQIRIEVVDIANDFQLFNHFNPTNALSPKSHSKKFACEQIIYWKRNSKTEDVEYKETVESETTANVKLRLTCVAPYVTKWTVNKEPNSEPGEEMDEREKELSFMEYSLKYLPRNNESPFHSDVVSASFNLTALTINSFGPEFRMGFIDCGSSSGATLSTRLYIYRHYDEYPDTKITPRVPKTFSDPWLVPCKGVFPDIKLTLLQQCSGSWSKNEDITHDFSYDWKSGFRRNKSRRRLIENEIYCCKFNGITYAQYRFVIPTEKTILNQFVPILADSLATVAPANNFRATCAAYGYVRPKASLLVESCFSPDHCYSHAHDTNQEKFQARLSCVDKTKKYDPENTDYVFTGLSGTYYLLSRQRNNLQNINDMIKLDMTERVENEVVVSCTVVQFLTSLPIRFSVYLTDGTEVLLENDESDAHNSNSEWTMTREKIIDLREANAKSFESIRCHAPLYNYKEWIHSSYVYFPKRSFTTATSTSTTITTNRETEMVTEATIRSVTDTTKENEAGTFKPTVNTPVVETTSTTTTTSRKTEEPTGRTKKPTTSESPSKADPPKGSMTVVITIIAIAVILSLIVLCCFVNRYYTVEIIWCPFCRAPRGETAGTAAHEMKPLKLKLEIPSNLQISAQDFSVDETKIVGEGQFNKVCRGILKHRQPTNKHVVVKFNKAANDQTQLVSILNDIKIRTLIGNGHLNILTIEGAHFDQAAGKVFIVMNFEKAISLRKYLVTRENKQQIMIMSPEDRMQTLLSWSKGVAYGVEFLHGQKIIHGNLAVENILVYPNKSVKITGFSYAHQLDKDKECTYFIRHRRWTDEWKSCGWQWMSMEALRYCEFSKQSDVWSFGILLWEIFSLGALPYNSSERDGGHSKYSLEFVRKLEFGLILSKPQYATVEIYSKMCDCWSRYGKDRPEMTELNQFFNDSLDAGRLNTYICYDGDSAV